VRERETEQEEREEEDEKNNSGDAQNFAVTPRENCGYVFYMPRQKWLLHYFL
jgi:hypothetical protein